MTPPASVPHSASPARVMLSCGEASGDLYAGALTQALRARGVTDVFGFGGPRLAAAGGELVGDYRRFAVTGLLEAVRVVPRSWGMMRRLGEIARHRRPEVFVAIDFPDFNFRLLPVMRQLGVPVVYYVSPQLWAWRPGRIDTIRRYVDLMLVLFPFEQDLYRRAGVPFEFVGHPLIDLAVASRGKGQVLAAAALDPSRPVVALLPGSRPNEIDRILPVMAAAAPIIRARVADAQFLVARAPSLDDGLFAPLAGMRAAGIPVATMDQATDDVLEAADVVITASGTATVQTALHGRPMVIVYKLSPVTSAIVRRVVRLSTYGMVNLVAGRQVVPELIQEGCTPERVAEEVVSLLTDGQRRERMTHDLQAVRHALGGGGATERVADAVLRVARAGRAEATA